MTKAEQLAVKMLNDGHSLFSPSAAHRWLKCTASPVFESQFEDDGSNRHANEGSLAHLLCEHLLNAKKTVTDDDLMALRFAGDEDLVPDSEMIECARRYGDYVRSLESNDSTTLVETQVVFPSIKEGFGTADTIVVNDEGLMHVVDFKYGKGVRVEVEGNQQLMIYAAGALDTARLLGYDVDTVEMHIFQPRIDNVSVWKVAADMLIKNYKESVLPVVEKILAEDTEFVTGDHCQFCKGASRCAARIADLNEFEVGREKIYVAGQKLTDEEISKVLSLARYVEPFINAVREEAKQVLLKGKPLKGWKLVAGRSIRKWRDDEVAEKALKNARVKAADMYAKKLISPTQAEKILGKDHALLKKHVVKPEGAPTLALENDKRPSITTENEFVTEEKTDG